MTLALPFETVLGKRLEGVSIMVEQHGSQSLPASRTIAIFPSFSHGSHIAHNGDDQSPGWWEAMVGPGKAIDTRHWRVICCSVLGSPYSPTSPTSVDPATGMPYRARFPTLTPTDLARCHEAVLQQLGVEGRLHAVIGSSLGGMQALQFASLYPSRVARLISIASTGRTTPFTVGIRRMQRKAVLWDPEYHGGDYAAHGVVPKRGLQIAREMGTLFYRSRQEFDTRFKWAPDGDRHYTALDTWEVEAYLTYAGAKFVRTYDANAYLLLSKCMDLMDLGDGYDGRLTYAAGAARIRAETLLVGVRQDALIPMQELRSLAELLNQGAAASTGSADGTAAPAVDGAVGSVASAAARGGIGHGGSTAAIDAHAAEQQPLAPLATFLEMDSTFGHDAFLKEFDWLSARIRPFLERGLEQQLQDESVHNMGLNAP